MAKKRYESLTKQILVIRLFVKSTAAHIIGFNHVKLTKNETTKTVAGAFDTFVERLGMVYENTDSHT